MKQKWIHLLITGSIMAGAFACTKKSPQPQNAQTPDRAASTPTPQLSPIEELLAVSKPLEKAEGTEIAFKLYQMSSIQPENILLSPLSLKLCLSLAATGANGKNLATLQSLIGKMNDESVVKNEKSSILQANSVWVKNEKLLTPKYKEDVKRLYSAKIGTLNLNAMNEWITEATQGLIPKLLDTLPVDASVILVNALYFKDKWKYPFKKQNTYSDVFQPSIHSSRSALMMHQTEELPYMEDSVSKWVELPYATTDLVMDLALPKKKFNLKALEEKLSENYVRDLFNKLRPEMVSLQLPKTNSYLQMSLKDPLVQSGYGSLFDANADYSKMFSGKTHPVVDDIIQAVHLKIDEDGTEAAASTAMMMVGAIIHEIAPKKFFANEPFIFILRNKKTNQIYFMGRIQDPTNPG